MFLQGVQGISTTLTGSLMTPFQVLYRVMGIAGGLLFARYRRYRFLLAGSYVLLIGACFIISRLSRDTSIPVILAISDALWPGHRIAADDQRPDGSKRGAPALSGAGDRRSLLLRLRRPDLGTGRPGLLRKRQLCGGPQGCYCRRLCPGY